MRLTHAAETQTNYGVEFPYKLRDSAFDVTKGLLSIDGDQEDAPLFRNKIL